MVKFNEFQTELGDLEKESPKLFKLLSETLDTIPMIRWLVQGKEVRGLAKDRPRGKDGRIEVDVTKPHILEDMDFFRQRAIFFEEHGKYTDLYPSRNPFSEYAKFWKEEKRRFKYGLTRESDGEWIPGYLYFYWNYSPIWQVKKTTNNSKGSKSKGERVRAFPKPYLGDYLFFHYFDQARENGQHTKMLKSRGVGMAGPLSEPILTPTGFKTYGDIEVGDLLIGSNGKSTKVVEKFPQGELDIYEVTTSDGRSTRCTADHLWAVYYKGERRVLRTKELINRKLSNFLTKGNYTKYYYTLPKVHPVEFDKKDYLIPPYTLGALIGDGSLLRGETKLSTVDLDIVDRVINELDLDKVTVEKANNDSHYHLIKKTNAQKVNYVTREIKQLGLSVKTIDKFIPEKYLHGDVEQRFALLQGLMDTDGSINKRGSISFSTISDKLKDDFIFLCRSLGVKVSSKKIDQHLREGSVSKHPIWRIQLLSKDSRIFHIKRKSERLSNKEGAFSKVYIKDVSKVGYKEDSVCFLVDNKDHTYLTTDFIPTHNSFKAGALGPCNMIIYPGSGNPNFYLASDKGFLSGDKGVFGKVVDTLDWLAEHTPFPRLRLVNSLRSMEIQLGYLDNEGKRKGALSSVSGISLKDNPDKARGIRGPMIFYEEDGLFPHLEKAWNVNRPGMEAGSVATGMMFAGGCLTAGNKVWNNNGQLVNIEDLNKEEGILGYSKRHKVSKENITYWQPPTKKECIKITTNTGRSIECSLDHPILWSNQKYGKYTELPREGDKRRRRFLKRAKFKEAQYISIGDQLAVAAKVDVFHNKKMWEPRLVGQLIGDGSYGVNKTPVLSNCELEINNYVENNFDCSIEKSHVTKGGKLYKEIRIRNITKQLRDLGIYGQTKLNKRLPVNFHDYDKHSMAEVIGGLFDTDGYISKTGTISLSQAGKDILLEVQLALQKFGVHGNINFKKPNPLNPKSKNGHYELEIKDKDSVLNFIENIKLVVKNKQDRLNNLKSLFKNKEEQGASHLKGLKFERVVDIENTGVKDVYNLTAGTTHTYIGNGIITHNTGGTEGASFEGSKKLFYSPAAYNIYGIPDFYNKNSQGLSECGFFWGAYMNREECNAPGGEPDVIKALIEILRERIAITMASNDPAAITQKKAEHPLTPDEAIMRTGGSIFPVADISEHLINIKANQTKFLSSHYVGRLVYEAGTSVKWLPDAEVFPIRSLDTSKVNRAGGVEIFEMPKYGADSRIQPGRYIAGIDPIDQDSGESLFAITVMDVITDRIVAQYIGRHPKAEQCYEEALKLLIFYNAKANYENNLKGLFSYFKFKNALHYLCDTPEILKEMEMIRPSANASKGTRATSAINAWGRQLQVSWMLTEYAQEEKEDGSINSILNLHKIRSLRYLEEAQVWNPDGNYDTVSAMGMLFIYREEKLRQITELKSDQEYVADSWADSDFFGKGNQHNKRLKRAEQLFRRRQKTV